MSGVDVNQGASRIAELLQQGQPQEEIPAQPSNGEEEPETVNAHEDEQETESTEHQEPKQEYEGGEETQEAEEAESDTDQEPKYTVKVNGEELEVGLEDLRKGYMMESDYRKKTSEVAKQREEFQKEKLAFAEKIQKAEELLISEAEDLNSDENKELKEYDPAAYYEKKEKLEQKARRLTELKEESNRIQLEQQTQKIEKEKELLMQALPEWLDDNVLAKETSMIDEMFKQNGIQGELLQPFVDHRLLVMARKAALYDKIKSAKPETKKVQVKPNSMTAGAPKSNEQIVKSKNDAARQKLKQSGKMGDAQAVIKSLLRN